MSVPRHILLGGLCFLILMALAACVRAPVAPALPPPDRTPLASGSPAAVVTRPTPAPTATPENGLVAALGPLGLSSLMPGADAAPLARRAPDLADAPPATAESLAAGAIKSSDHVNKTAASPSSDGGPTRLALPLLAASGPQYALQPPAGNPQASPSPSSVPVPVPTASPAELLPTAKASANLRAGPGLNYAVVRMVAAGGTLDIVACNADRSWYKLSNGTWVFGELVDNAPRALQVVQHPSD